MTDEKKGAKTESNFNVVEVPTQTGLAIRNPEGNLISELELLVRIANEIEVIKKRLG